MEGPLDRGSWHIASIRGIPIRVHYSWLIIFGVLTWSLSTYYFPRVAPDLPSISYWMKGALAALSLFVSVVFHELAHSFMSLRYRMPIQGITIFIFGGVAEMRGEPPTPRAEFLIAVVGPLSSIALAGIFSLLQSLTQGSGTGDLFAYIARVNLALGIFNLIPGFPMDGGRVLRAFLWKRKGDYLYATRKAAAVGEKIAMFFVFLGVFSIFTGAGGGIWMVLMGWFLYSAAHASLHQAGLQSLLSGVKVRDVMVQDIVSVSPALPLAELVDRYFLRYGFGGFPVMEDGRLLGMVTLKEVKEVSREDWGGVPTEQVYARRNNRFEIGPDADVMTALTRMVTEDQGRLAVIEDGKMVGLITRNGIAQYIQVADR